MSTLAHPADAPAHATHDSARRIRAIIAGSSGNLVEWFDFYVYSFTALYFASAFFPEATRRRSSSTPPVFSPPVS